MKTRLTYYTYIVRCSDGTYYTGITRNIEKRVKQHNGHLKGGAKYTKGKQPVALVYTEKHTTHKLAAQREYEIKQLSRSQKEALCAIFIHPGIY